VVYKAQDSETNQIVALKKIKMEIEREGFPLTSLREVKTLMQCQHPNIVGCKEIVAGSDLSR
jgi:cell division cycle 2-like protein